MTTSQTPQTASPDRLRQAALDRLGKKRELEAHLLAFVMVNAALTVIWLTTDPGGFFWPIFPLLIWGIGVVFHLWDFLVGNPSENAVRAEIDRLNHR